MTRYTINIGDDFPLGGDEPPAPGDQRETRPGRGRRYGLFLRVLFFLAVAAIVISHPLQTLLVVGAVLLVRRSPWFAEWRERMRSTWRNGAWRNGQWCRDGWSAWSAWSRCGRRQEYRPASGDDQRAEHDRDGGYRGFV